MEINTDQVSLVYTRPLMELVRDAAQVHARAFPDGKVQASSLLSIKTGGCPENCAYCPQSAHYATGVGKTPVLPKETVVESARRAKALGASRFCMGAAWREVRDGKDFDQVLELVTAVADLDLEVCCTLGMLNAAQARRLKDAGLDFYNHNIDTSRAHYAKVIQTRDYDDRLETLQRVRDAGLSVCTGGILGLGETDQDRIEFIAQLCSLQPLPESVTINTLVPVEGTPLAASEPVDPLDVVRVIATVRILAPNAKIRLSAGRMQMEKTAQFLCFLAGANSIFLGEKLLTSANPETVSDLSMLKQMGLGLEGVPAYELT